MVSWWVATAASVGAGAALVAALHIRSRRRPAVRSWWQGVEVRPSRIDGAGDGLFTTRRFVVGEVLGLYYGRVLSLVEATRLSNRDYLMGGFGLNAHVDVRAASRLALPSRLPQSPVATPQARFALDAPARYVNDHFDRDCLNARFVKSRAERRARLVATRTILPGEEVYAAYGQAYWRARGIDPLGPPAAVAAEHGG
jgi:hypothetical protein